MIFLLLACSDPLTDGKSPGPDTDAGSEDTAPDDTAPACFADRDLDGFGDPASPTPGCGPAAVPDATDCDDTDATVSPGAREWCNTLDDDCDGRVDDDDDDLTDGLPFWADADGDGYGSDTLVTACSANDAVALQDGDCDDTDPAVNPDAVEACDGVDRNCDGIGSTETGSSAACAASTCLEALAGSGSGARDGAYWLALPSGETAAVWCDMTTDGGGWTLGFLRNTASTASQGDFGSGDESLDTLATSPEDASASATPALAWLDLNTFEWTDLRLAAYASGDTTYTSRTIPRDALRIPFGSDGYYLYGGDTGYYWCGGNASYTDGGVGAVDNPAGAPADCKYHGSLGSGWDFSESPSANQGLTLCGGDGSYWLYAAFANTLVYYGTVGGAQAIWVR